MKRELDELRRKNEELTEDLAQAREEAENSTQPKRGSKGSVSTRTLQKQVADLRSKVRGLKRVHAKDKRKISKQLRAKEIRQDAEELEDKAEYEVGDTTHRMRKLLRRFHDLILVNTLENDEECAICMEPMKVGKTRSFPCEHTVCEDCTELVAESSELVRCPSCRKEARQDELEAVEYTATKQWDELLAIATAWAEIDHRREMDTSEEEAEEEFINDNTTAETRSVASESVPMDPLGSSPEPEGANDDADRPSASQSSRIVKRVTSPAEESPQPARDQEGGGAVETSRSPTPGPSSSQPVYSESPTKDKRRRMEELAQSRLQKRQHLL